jgi:16S rRNA (guanine527-N7)-methyltransferase
VSVETEAVAGVLERSHQLGFLGPGPVSEHIRHAVGFAAGLDTPPRRLLDLGSGGGVPGLVLATVVWSESTAVLLDAGLRRCVFLEETVEELGLHQRVSVRRDRAEAAGRDPELRGTFDIVVARSFGPPAVTAECAAPFLRVGGVLVVSEPPPTVQSRPSAAPASEPGDARRAGAGPAGDAEEEGELAGSRPPVRWPDAGLAVLGLRRGAKWASPFHYQALVQHEPCPDRFPRRVGVPAKRPLF